ncbi:unnamed protein product [Protopolystoma xenopodis]|uniref:Uncharacterized protein n=1 Tax=Protopolystoma xenopodis TaxID=117903 RepID=A0A3S5FFN9_9PLAT|nr:unnamed protein product [Protopolystoma xenopodis]
MALLQCGQLSPSWLDGHGQTTLAHAVSHGYLSGLQAMRQRGADINAGLVAGPLHYAAAGGHLGCLHYLLTELQGGLGQAANRDGYESVPVALSSSMPFATSASLHSAQVLSFPTQSSPEHGLKSDATHTCNWLLNRTSANPLLLTADGRLPSQVARCNLASLRIQATRRRTDVIRGRMNERELATIILRLEKASEILEKHENRNNSIAIIYV